MEGSPPSAANNQEKADLSSSSSSSSGVVSGRISQHSASGEDARRRRLRARERWRRAAAMAREQLFQVDPLAGESLAERPSSVVSRHRWIEGRWEVDVATLKVAPRPFACGSMRVCYYAKKMSSRVTVRHVASGSRHASWKYQRNYVLKTYKDASLPESEVRRRLEDDVRTQAESKRFARLYNERLRGLLKEGKFDRRSPKPMKYKCVDMLEACLVVFPDQRCYLMEAHVTGDFRKHNDNFGFVGGVAPDDLTPWRATPQAFSHFTFEHSRGAMIVVDVQGVGDLFTDPQIHTRDSVGFGVGNGGLRGMALFFATHRCNRICRCMGLHPFFAERLAPDDDSDDVVVNSKSSSSRGVLLLEQLQFALDEYRLDDDDRGDAARNDDPRRVGRLLPRPVADALDAIVQRASHCQRQDDDDDDDDQVRGPPQEDPRRRRRQPEEEEEEDDDEGAPARLLRQVHRTLGFMLLRREDAIAKVASLAGALYHLAAAALGRDPSALRFAKAVVDAHRDALALDRLRRKNAWTVRRQSLLLCLCVCCCCCRRPLPSTSQVEGAAPRKTIMLRPSRHRDHPSRRCAGPSRQASSRDRPPRRRTSQHIVQGPDALLLVNYRSKFMDTVREYRALSASCVLRTWRVLSLRTSGVKLRAPRSTVGASHALFRTAFPVWNGEEESYYFLFLISSYHGHGCE